MQTEEPFNAQAPARRSPKRWWVIGIVLALLWLSLAWGLVSLWNGFWHTMGSIVPGSRDQLSTSMEPIDLSLKSLVQGDNNLKDPIEWHSRIPRAYLRNEMKDGEGIFGIDHCCHHYIHLEAVYDSSTHSLVPTTLAPQENVKNSSVSIELSNRGALREIASGDYCIRADDLGQFMKERGSNIDWNRPCDTAYPKCPIYTHIDGWLATYTVSRALYAQPQKMCTAMKKFLDQYTVKRDVRY